MHRRLVSIASTFVLATAACDDTDSSRDSGVPPADATVLDASAPDAAPDAGFEDATPPDTGADAGVTVSEGFEAGSHVQLAEGRVTIGATFANVKTAIGQPTRMSPSSGTATPRSYEWDLPSGAHVVVWFADTDLSQGTIDETDKALWVAVDGTFTGRSGSGIGLGSTQAEARGVYGVAERSGTVADPPGTVDAWYTKGILVAYGTNGQARTITISRSYPNAPDAILDFAGGRVDFPPAIVGGAVLGSEPGVVENILGAPDGEGNVSPGGTDLLAYSYAFIGIEVFFADVLGSNRTAFVTVHAPFYGATQSGITLGSTRTDFEAHLASLGFDSGRPTTASPELICYINNSTRRGAAATFSSETPSLVTTISVGFPSQACR